MSQKMTIAELRRSGVKVSVSVPGRPEPLRGHITEVHAEGFVLECEHPGLRVRRLVHRYNYIEVKEAI